MIIIRHVCEGIGFFGLVLLVILMIGLNLRVKEELDDENR